MDADFPLLDPNDGGSVLTCEFLSRPHHLSQLSYLNDVEGRREIDIIALTTTERT